MAGLQLIEIETACSRCGAPLRIATVSGSAGANIYCNRCAAALNAERERRRALERQAMRLRRALERSGIPPEFADFDVRLAWNMGEIRRWVREHRCRSLFIASRVSGIGKTRGAAAVALEEVERGADVYWVETTEWLRRTCRMMGDDGRAAERRICRAQHCGLLVLDDLGTEVVTARAAEIIWEIIDRRTRSRRRRTWVTTNCTGAELAERLGPVGQKTLRRLRDVCAIWSPVKQEV